MLKDGLYLDILRSLATAYVGQAILSLQLLGNHYDRPWEHKHVQKDQIGWMARQVDVCVDYDGEPALVRWLHGGLDDHTVHHLFPRMSREHASAANAELDKALDKLQLRRNRRPFWKAMWDLAAHMLHVLDEVVATPLPSKAKLAEKRANDPKEKARVAKIKATYAARKLAQGRSTPPPANNSDWDSEDEYDW